MNTVHTHPLSTFHYCPKCGAPFIPYGMKAARCMSCGFVYYFNPSAATVAVIVNVQGELLVCRRAKKPAMGTLDLPGGFCDMYETAEQGVIREVAEETGVEVRSVEYLFSLPNTYLYSGFLVHTIDCFFRCEVEEKTCIQAADDVAECFWIPMHQVRPEEFGLDSIRAGVERLLDMKDKIL